MDRCLDDELLAALLEHRLSADEDAHVVAHMDRCDACRELVASALRALTAPTRAPGSASGDGGAPGDGSPEGNATFGRYRLIERLGQGGMGVVHAAYDPELDRRIALKLVRADNRARPALRRRLLREAQAMARVSHRNVVTVFDVGTVADDVYVAMELIDGGTLRGWLRERRRPWRQILACFVDAGRGLAAAHRAGLVHRDFKPDNVLISRDGHVYVTDFGLARAASEADAADGAPSPRSPVDERVTETGAAVGTPAYMSPEQLRGEPTDTRSDQFSFCVALYEALWQQPPFAGATPEERERATLAGALQPRRGGAPRWVYDAVARGLRAEPAQRWPSLDPLLARLDRGPRRRQALAALGGAAVIAGVVALGAGAVTRDRRARARPAAHSVRRLTFAPGCEEFPEFTPDGRSLIYDGLVDGMPQVIALDLAAGTTRPLTKGPGANRQVSLSPDGVTVTYLHEREGPRQLRALRLDGAMGERVIGPSPGGGRAWIDGGRRLVSIGHDGALVSWDLADAQPAPRPFYRNDERHGFRLLSAFRDGTLAIDWNDPPGLLGVGLLAHDRLSVLASRMPYTESVLLAAPSQQAIYIVRRTGAANELVRIPRDGGEPSVVAGGVSPSNGLAISADGKRMAFSTCANYPHLVRIGADGSLHPLLPRGPWSDTQATFVDAHRVLFVSDRSSHDQLYVADLADGSLRAVSTLDIEDGTVSRDGRWIVYATRNPTGLATAALDGSGERRLTSGALDSGPTFTRDGEAILFNRREADGDYIWIVPRTGGSARRLTGPGWDAVLSPVDDRVYFMRSFGSSKRLMVTDVHGATPRPLRPALPPSGNYWGPVISPDGRRLSIVHDGYEIVELTIDGDEPPRVRHRSTQWLNSLAGAPDGDLVAAVDEDDGDLWLADGRFD